MFAQCPEANTHLSCPVITRPSDFRLQLDLQIIEQVRSDLKFRGAQGMQVENLLSCTGGVHILVSNGIVGTTGTQASFLEM